MLTIYAATKYHEQLSTILKSEHRLEELVRIVDYLEEKPVSTAMNLVVKSDAIFPLLDWFDVMPPYLLAEKLDLRPEYLLSLLYSRLNNYERVYHFLAGTDPSLNHELDIYNRLQHGLTIDANDLPSSLDYFDEFRLMHNHAVIRHYGTEQVDPDQTKYYYLQALETAPSGEHRAYTARHFGMLLMDLGEYQDAIRVLQVGLASAESEAGKTALRFTLCQARMALVSPVSGTAQLEEVKRDLWLVLEAFEQQDRPMDTAMVLLDAGTICHYEKSWSEGLGYLSRAIALLEQEEEAELILADAYLRKGGLLLGWAQDGNPQFYRKAAEALQRAARSFTREQAPMIYVDIQQKLGLIYAEIPDEAKKKGMWAAMSSTAFQEALSMLNSEEHPQEYAMVCNHYGNALIKYPEAKLTDNVEKALYFYQEALKLRPADTMPLERSVTLLNYLEGQWFLGMPEDTFDEARFTDMVDTANQVIAISPDPKLTAEAENHLQKLHQLKAAYA
jgi:tetratricopeptide (TPR) repeat protein